MKNLTSLRWNVTVPLLEDSGESGIGTGIVTTTVPKIPPLELGSADSTFLFNISRLSTYGTLPLISTLSVANITSLFNGSTVGCYESNDISTQVVSAIDVISVGANGT